jgi:hypothetical protein
LIIYKSLGYLAVLNFRILLTDVDFEDLSALEKCCERNPVDSVHVRVCLLLPSLIQVRCNTAARVVVGRWECGRLSEMFHW